MASLNAGYIKLFADLVVAGRWTIDKVPEAYKAAVQKYIDEQSVEQTV